MRWDLIQQVLAPRVTLADVERELRRMFKGRKSEEEIEDIIGRLYGRAMKKAEEKYDALGGRWHPERL